MNSLILKSLLILVVLAACETVHGILRAKFLAPKVGDLLSRQIAVFTGSLIIFTITYLSFDWLQIQNSDQAYLTGALWFFGMLTFELFLGHFVFKFSWKWLLNDFNFFKGRLLLFGMIFLFLAPNIVGKIKGLF